MQSINSGHGGREGWSPFLLLFTAWRILIVFSMGVVSCRSASAGPVVRRGRVFASLVRQQQEQRRNRGGRLAFLYSWRPLMATNAAGEASSGLSCLSDVTLIGFCCYSRSLLFLPRPQVNDRGLYVPGQMWLSREDILGRARGTLRYVGMVTIILNDYPPLK